MVVPTFRGQCANCYKSEFFPHSPSEPIPNGWLHNIDGSFTCPKCRGKPKRNKDVAPSDAFAIISRDGYFLRIAWDAAEQAIVKTWGQHKSHATLFARREDAAKLVCESDETVVTAMSTRESNFNE